MYTVATCNLTILSGVQRFGGLEAHPLRVYTVPSCVGCNVGSDVGILTKSLFDTSGNESVFSSKSKCSFGQAIR